jgi:hypothetical protein
MLYDFVFIIVLKGQLYLNLEESSRCQSLGMEIGYVE